MEREVIKVDGMSCEHCVAAVSKAVGALSGIGNVIVDLDAGTVEVTYDPAQNTLDNIRTAIEDQGYDVIQG